MSLDELQSTETSSARVVPSWLIITHFKPWGKFFTRVIYFISDYTYFHYDCLCYKNSHDFNKEGLIRVGVCLEKSALTVRQKHPIILHRTDHLSKLICTQLHIDNLPVGHTAWLALVL